MERRFRKAALWGATVAAVLAAVGPFSPAHGVPRPDPTSRPSPRGMLDAMRRDLGLSAVQVRTRLAQETDAHRAAATVRRTLSTPPAGMWFDRTTGKLVVAVTGAADAQRVRAAGAVPKTVPHSRAALTALMQQITRRAGDGVAGVTGWGVDERANGVVVRIDRTRHTPRTAAFEKTVRELGARGKIPVTVERSNQTPRQQGGKVVGGERWMPGSEGICSIGFSVTGPGSFQGFLTAGHCTLTADQAAFGKDGSLMGTSNHGGGHSVNGREGDLGLVEVDQPGWTVSANVAGQGGAPVTVTGAQEGLAGMSLCHSGQSSGWHCGEITRVDQTVDYGNTVIEGLSFTNACSAPGDSGGSYVTQPNAPKALGVHSGGGAAHCGTFGGATLTIFQPIGEALEKWNLRLVTGSP
ncbi:MULTISPECIES: S1 family peptidase [Streptomyces]|uniref:S1 family peptidase n=1 Tax=Streptomyces TaxID=1883 RepID=UPI00037201ED|nr:MULTISPECIES: S1 family peptidase [unclassified Streptomyces]MCW7989572.1 secreted serine protease [Streptomyces platensis subsp. clarensis]MYT13109.1 S1 family peptidase [Streptomyces sp. SID4951]MYX05358.1 S1 family peptidase [Streptomyces sp. SID8375]SCK44971.1 streptogrisin C [Streptomyces sp. SceaMP-e96]